MTITQQMTTEELTFMDFWAIFLGSYLCIMTPDRGQAEGCIPSDDLGFCDEEQAYKYMQKFQAFNKMGWNVHFTPNGVKTPENKNQKENFSHINSFFVDIDIEETKEIKEDADIEKRQEGKNKILAMLFSLPLPIPSLTVETRNGYQVYWFVNNAIDGDFERIQRALAIMTGGDVSCSRRTSMLRVPFFKYYKKGETGIVTPSFLFSSLLVYSQEEITRNIIWPAEVEPEQHEPVNYIHRVDRPKFFGIWGKIYALPVKDVIERLSGESLVNGERFILKRSAEFKYNLFVNGNISPNWIDIQKNMVFSNNEPKFCTILHFLLWYGNAREDIKEQLKTMFSL